MQNKIQQPFRFELTDQTRGAVAIWLDNAGLKPEGYLFSSRVAATPHLSTRQYARLVKR